MLDSVIKLTEKFAELLRYREERRARWFREIVNPTYQSLKTVHKDYLHSFQGLLKDVEAGQDLSSAAERFEQRRLSEESERQAIASLARELANDSKLDAYRTYFDAVIDYFGRAPFSRSTTPSSMLRGAVLRILESSSIELSVESTQERKRQELIAATNMALESLRENWETVSRRYAKALAASIL